MQAVRYDKEMLASLDGIIKCAADVLDDAREKMAVAGDIPTSAAETLLAMRDEMAMRLAAFEAGLYVPPEQLDIVADMEDDATDILNQLGHDQPDYECPEFRQHRERALVALLKSGTR